MERRFLTAILLRRANKALGKTPIPESNQARGKTPLPERKNVREA